MRVRIEATSDAVAARVRRLLHFSLASVADEIGEAHVVIAFLRDPLGMPLIRCRTELRLREGGCITVEDVQSSVQLAVMRALERGLRTLRRRLHR